MHCYILNIETVGFSAAISMCPKNDKFFHLFFFFKIRKKVQNLPQTYMASRGTGYTTLFFFKLVLAPFFSYQKAVLGKRNV